MARSGRRGESVAGLSVVDELLIIQADLAKRSEELARTGTLASEDVSAELDLRVRKLSDARFGQELTAALSERDARLIEMEVHATKRYHLLEDASAAARRFETETQAALAALEVERAATRELRELVNQATAKTQELTDLCEDLRARAERSEIGGFVDIYREGDLLVLTGSGWYAVESSSSGPFRWVGAEADLTVAQMTRSPYSLLLEIEPGPAVGAKPFDIGVTDDGVKIETLKVPGRKVVQLDLPGGSPKIRCLKLRVENAGPPSPTPGDTRTLSYRIFKIELVRKPADIVHAGQNVKVGTGWYPLETFKGETFRWAGPEASFELEKRDGPVEVALEVEPGPGVSLKPFKIKTFLNDKPLGEAEVKTRQRLIVTCPAGGVGLLRIKVDGGGEAAPNDPRIMNFRAFSAAD